MAKKMHLALPTVLLIAAALAALAGPALASGPPRFANPARCLLGETCWIANYVDTDEAAARHADFRCGSQTYDGHDGVDIAVRDAAAMRDGIDALAAANGTVLRVRDGAEDRQPAPDELRQTRVDVTANVGHRDARARSCLNCARQRNTELAGRRYSARGSVCMHGRRISINGQRVHESTKLFRISVTVSPGR